MKVRRERPTIVAGAMALAITMGMVYLATIGVRQPVDRAARERVTQEITLSGVEVWLVELGEFEDETSARIAAARLTELGAAGVVLTEDSCVRVLGAAYESEADAARIAERLRDQDDLSSAVLARSVPAVTMRITAPQEDIDAIVGADTALRAALRQAGTLALQIDRGEIGARSARLLAAVSRSELSSALKCLKNVEGAQENAICSAFLSELQRLSDDLGETAQGNADGAALSGRLRACHVRGILGLINLMQNMQA